MKQPVLLLGFLCLLLAGDTAVAETLLLNSYRMTFRGFSEDTNRGIEEYIVEFPGYTGHKLISEELSGSEYQYNSRDVADGIVTNLRRMFVYLDVGGKIDADELQITVTHPLYEEPPEPKATPRIALLPSRTPTPTATPKPLTLRLSTARGDKPVFAVGETFDLTVELSRDAWLYCFYRRVDGKVVKFFPNPHHEDAWISGGRAHRVPGAIYPFELEFTEPPGNELLTCFATGRDVRTDLPAVLRTPDLAVLPPGVDSRLDDLFDGLAIARASLPITVKR